MASLVLYLEDDSVNAYPLDPEQPLTIGRHKDNALYLTCESVSSHHAVLTRRDDGWYVQDLGSSNGTRVNGAPIEEALLLDGDRVAFGKIHGMIYFRDADAAAAVASGSAPAEPVKIGRPPPPPPAPPRRKLPAERMKEVSRTYPGAETSGLMNSLLILGLCLLAVVVGLALRHQSETGRNFFSDAFNSLMGELPRITIEKKAE